jgi:hypothetical protein
MTTPNKLISSVLKRGSKNAVSNVAALSRKSNYCGASNPDQIAAVQPLPERVLGAKIHNLPDTDCQNVF